ncbi:MAG: hypothetical protein QNK37_32880, partial [Acidobacteriota bacterium]|nr:hypothetical protein [Acidobacteriota bacterium]
MFFRLSFSVLSFVVWAGDAAITTPIEAFGATGKRAATFLGVPLPDSFYAQSPLQDMTNGENYTTLVELEAAEAHDVPAELTLINEDTDLVSAIVLTAVDHKRNTQERFLVKVG